MVVEGQLLATHVCHRRPLYSSVRMRAQKSGTSACENKRLIASLSDGVDAVRTTRTERHTDCGWTWTSAEAICPAIILWSHSEGSVGPDGLPCVVPRRPEALDCRVLSAQLSVCPTSGKIKVGSREYPKSPSVKNNRNVVTPLVLTPVVPFRARACFQGNATAAPPRTPLGCPRRRRRSVRWAVFGGPAHGARRGRSGRRAGWHAGGLGLAGELARRAPGAAQGGRGGGREGVRG